MLNSTEFHSQGKHQKKHLKNKKNFVSNTLIIEDLNKHHHHKNKNFEDYDIFKPTAVTKKTSFNDDTFLSRMAIDVKIRTDAFGNEIIKGRHRCFFVSFIDEISDNKINLQNIVNVESYKKYNENMAREFKEFPHQSGIGCQSSLCIIY